MPSRAKFDLRFSRRSLCAHSAFTFIEVMAAMVITSIAGAVLLLGVTTSMEDTQQSMYKTIADGLAAQLMDEIVGGRYMEFNGSAYNTTLGPDSGESTAGPRSAFDDIDDYNGISFKPPVDAYNVALGKEDDAGGTRDPNFCVTANFLTRWKETVTVSYASSTDYSTKLTSGTSDYRIIEVKIYYTDQTKGDRELAVLRRTVAYVAPIAAN